MMNHMNPKQLTTAVLAVLVLIMAACAPDARESRSDLMFDETNPFYAPSTLPFEAPDFDAITDDHYKPALLAGMEREMGEIEAIATNPEPPTFENTIVAMQRTGDLLTRVQRVFFNMTSAHTNENIQRIQSEMAPRFAEHSDNILLNAELFGRVRTLYDRVDELGLDEASEKLLRDNYRNFVRAGALLDETEQQRIREINSETVLPQHRVPGETAGHDARTRLSSSTMRANWKASAATASLPQKKPPKSAVMKANTCSDHHQHDACAGAHQSQEPRRAAQGMGSLGLPRYRAGRRHRHASDCAAAGRTARRAGTAVGL
jgi:hypothetical protein